MTEIHGKTQKSADFLKSHGFFNKISGKFEITTDFIEKSAGSVH
jgi:hypothetical protein